MNEDKAKTEQIEIEKRADLGGRVPMSEIHDHVDMRIEPPRPHRYSQFSLLTKEGALEHFQYKPPTTATQPKFGLVTSHFMILVAELYDLMPDGPGKTLALRKLSEARMAVNSAIANEGQ